MCECAVEFLSFILYHLLYLSNDCLFSKTTPSVPKTSFAFILFLYQNYGIVKKNVDEMEEKMFLCELILRGL